MSQTSSAAIVGFGDFAQFEAAASGTATTIDFDSLAAGSAVGVIGDTTFSTSGTGLQVYATDGIDDGTISPDNYVGNDFVLFPELADELITISFGEARSAAGIWVVYDAAPSSSFVLTTTGGLFQTSSPADPTVDLPGGARAHFIGFVEDTGENTISSISLQNPTASPGYFFDSQISYISAVAIPEPGSLAFLAAISGLTIIRRRR
ncbi:MAG: PEP-CTERM sorting domain-containing protein [Planctomycetota bacterium]